MFSGMHKCLILFGTFSGMFSGMHKCLILFGMFSGMFSGMHKCLILFGILFRILFGMYSGMQKRKEIHSLTCNSSYLYDASLSICLQGSTAVCVHFAESLYAFWLVRCPVINKT